VEAKGKADPAVNKRTELNELLTMNACPCNGSTCTY